MFISRAVRLTSQGNYLNVKVYSGTPFLAQLKTVRGEIKEFSSQSRKRMIDMLAKLDRRKVKPDSTKFITLTYKKNMTDSVAAKRDLKVFIQRIRRKFPKSWLIWKYEKQKRGAIHFHIMLGNVRFWRVQDAQRAWNEITGEAANNSLDLDRVRSFNGVMWYASKYMCKAVDTQFERNIIAERDAQEGSLLGLSMSHTRPVINSWTGRWWGWSGKENMPLAEKREIMFAVTPAILSDMKTLVDSDYASCEHSYTIYRSDALETALSLALCAVYHEQSRFAINDWRDTLRSAYARIRETANLDHVKLTEMRREKGYVMAMANLFSQFHGVAPYQHIKTLTRKWGYD